MVQKLFVVGLLGASLAALGAPRAEAHYIVVSGALKWHSLDCGLDLKGVANPATNPAASRCTVTASLIEVLCENPANQEVAPGKSAIREVTLVGSEQIDQADITGRGKAHVDVHVPTDALLDPEFCVNPNWHPVLALVRQAQVQIDTFECLDAECTQLGERASTADFSCVLPPEFTLQDPPAPGDLYACGEVTSAHLR
jgi:hypothetical protein